MLLRKMITECWRHSYEKHMRVHLGSQWNMLWDMPFSIFSLLMEYNKGNNYTFKIRRKWQKEKEVKFFFLMLPWYSLRFKLKDIYENPNHMVHVHLTNKKSYNLKFVHSCPKWIYDGKQPHEKRQIRSSSRLRNISLWYCVSPSNYIY